ncbi:alkaline phosphatase D [Caulobacter ginsengisoli]|uniref:Alkaline phosphatase D n=1 Tax=Caulobacter ginsengisoli TaxID=400775 RepID=A0ABU0IWF8_9CAUL|nr:alkaline phosphatase D family protein [Caulobacter ginsengisoli]MDQ0466344.1 alkaline phosphatase D [Caulobacter ginsengisoli]
MRLDRRQALALLGAAAAPGAACAAPPAVTFSHGVASGDPLSDRVMLWTRITPAGEEAVKGDWQVAADAGFGKIVRKGSFTTDAGRDWTVKVDATDLKPGQAYWYRFRVGGVASPIGRARTLPAGPTKDVVLAVASCSLWQGGHFNAYQAIADLKRVDAVLHLGDYIYEYGKDGYGAEQGQKLNRFVDPPHEILTLADYRRRHAQAKSDPKLQAAHARAPWIVVWDDHESANDTWQGGAENHQPDKEGDWATRKAAAIRAYFEWMPIREPAPGKMSDSIWRGFQFGDLVSLLMVETRISARSRQLTYAADLPGLGDKPDVAAFKARLTDPARRLMSPDQEAWLTGELKSSVAGGKAWQVIGNQVVMARATAPDLVKTMGRDAFEALLAKQAGNAKKRLARVSDLAALGLPYNLDSWDGYPADRERVYAAFTAAKARPIVLSGDSHAFWANQLADASGRRVAAEFGATGITSPGFSDAVPDAPIGQAFADASEEVVFNDSGAKGFVLLTLTREQARADMVAVSTIMEPAFETRTLASFTVAAEAGGVGPVVKV